MTRKNLQILAAVVVALVLVALILNKNNHGGNVSSGRLLLQEFAQQANEAQHVSVIAAEGDPIMIGRKSNQWVVASHDNYPADISKIRQIIVALANAKILEEKTSNPDLYEKLEIDDPQTGGSGTTITIDGDGFAYSVVVGKQVQGGRRYVRVAGTEPGYLIDLNLNIPHDSNGWLLPGIVDINAKSVRRVTISHENGETIIVEKSSEDLTDFAVLGIPQGRDLSYASVGNGIAGVLSNLDLVDVRAAITSAPTSSAVFLTWDGMKITVEIHADDQSAWLTLGAAVQVDQAADRDDSTGTTDANLAAVGDKILKLNKRFSGWQFELADYKKELLTKHWEDILKPLKSESK